MDSKRFSIGEQEQEEELVQLYLYDVLDPGTPLEFVGSPVAARIANRTKEIYEQREHDGRFVRLGSLNPSRLLFS